MMVLQDLEHINGEQTETAMVRIAAVATRFYRELIAGGIPQGTAADMLVMWWGAVVHVEVDPGEGD
jgi:hypothetical protein